MRGAHWTHVPSIPVTATLRLPSVAAAHTQSSEALVGFERDFRLKPVTGVPVRLERNPRESEFPMCTREPVFKACAGLSLLPDCWRVARLAHAAAGAIVWAHKIDVMCSKVF